MGFLPRPRWGSSQGSARPPSWILGGPTSKGKEGKGGRHVNGGRDKKERSRKGKDKKGKGRGGKGKGHEASQLKTTPLMGVTTRQFFFKLDANL